jgi:hypothetical protein
MSSITYHDIRKDWREHLIGVAIANDQADEELGDFSEEMLDHAAHAVSDLIASATFLEHESTGDLIDAVYARIHEARVERREETAQRERDQWVNAVNTGKTNSSYSDWRVSRGWPKV